MDVLTTVSSMQAVSRATHASGKKVGFVPTMGFLHDGHLSLMQLARDKRDILVVSIFVNPTQFSPNEDLDQYPRDLDRDLALCESCGVDVVFFPPVEEMYAADSSVYVNEECLSAGLCGHCRPGHFRGVLTVVAKLFNMVAPDVCVFGQKDAQQLALIRRMVRDLNFAIEIIAGAIVREAGGLAMSSRNTYLSPVEREQAMWLNRSLKEAKGLVAAGQNCTKVLEESIRSRIGREAPGIAIEYIEIVNGESLASVEIAESGTLIAIAVQVGKTRLIDNVLL